MTFSLENTAVLSSRSLKPSVTLCHLAENMPLATNIQRYLKVPIVLHEEVASKIVNSAFVGRWQTRAVRVLMGQPITGKSYWSWLCQRADALITSEPHDKAQLESLGAYGKPLYYLPWPDRIPETCALPAKRCKFRAIYAGTLLPNKNTQELSWIIPLILEKTETKEFVIVGSGSHERVIEKLKQQFGERIIRIPSLPRCEVLKLIAGSQYAFSPVKEGGWGFLGDCWGTRTPLFMLTNIFQEKILDYSGC